MSRARLHEHHFIDGVCTGCGALGDGNDGLPKSPWHDKDRGVLLERAQVVEIDPEKDFVVLTTPERLRPEEVEIVRQQVLALWEGLPKKPETVILEGGMTFEVYRKQSEGVEITDAAEPDKLDKLHVKLGPVAGRDEEHQAWLEEQRYRQRMQAIVDEAKSAPWTGERPDDEGELLK